jgi:hypothetical protein
VKRPLRPIDWLVKIPLGLVWFGVLAILAVPVVLYMTGLHYVIGRVRAPRSGGGSDQGTSRTEAA